MNGPFFIERATSLCPPASFLRRLTMNRLVRLF